MSIQLEDWELEIIGEHPMEKVKEPIKVTPPTQAWTNPSTADVLIAGVHRGLDLVPMGHLPETKWKAGEYRALFEPRLTPTHTLIQHITGWYFLQLQLAWEPDVFRHRRDYLQRKADDTFFAIIHFLSDYLVAACLAESRHFAQYQAVFNCAWCKKYLAHIASDSSSRYKHVNGTWPLYETRGEALKWLLHVFLHHGWNNSTCGGPNWGYIALLATRFNEGLLTGDVQTLTTAFNDLMYAHHCSGSIVQSRFTWSQGLIGYNLERTLSANYSGKSCCWRKLVNYGLLAPTYATYGRAFLDSTTDLCGCSTKDKEHGRNAQVTFAHNVRNAVSERHKCGANKLAFSCYRYCGKCCRCIPGPPNQLVNTKNSTHRHNCTVCNAKRPDPEATTPCPTWCDICETCAGHKVCHAAGKDFSILSGHLECPTCCLHSICTHNLPEEFQGPEWAPYVPCLYCSPEFNTPKGTDAHAILMTARRTEAEMFYTTIPERKMARRVMKVCILCNVTKGDQPYGYYYDPGGYSDPQTVHASPICSLHCLQRANKYNKPTNKPYKFVHYIYPKQRKTKTKTKETPNATI